MRKIGEAEEVLSTAVSLLHTNTLSHTGCEEDRGA